MVGAGAGGARLRSPARLLCLTSPARAEPITLRLGTLAPDGTAWSHELRAAARELDERTAGQVRIKWIFGGLAGDEAQVLDRVARGQLDGRPSRRASLTILPVGITFTRSHGRHGLDQIARPELGR